MSYHWIHAEDYDINTLLLLDRWMLRHLAGLSDSGYMMDARYRLCLGAVLRAHPHLAWYFTHRCPESAEVVSALIAAAPDAPDAAALRAYEVELLDTLDAFVVYTDPAAMNACPYIRDWTPERLLEMADFRDKVVLDVGSGTGRLAFAAATVARRVYASEPGDCLREYLREEAARRGVDNVVVLDGVIEAIPFEPDTFDIAMTAHVLGVDLDREIANLERVVKPGGLILDCMGEDDRRQDGPNEGLLRHGFTYAHYIGRNGGDIYRYCKRVEK